MYLFWISIKKEFIQLSRDRVGLLLMFVMPVLLAVVMTALQNSVYRMVNENRINMLVCNNDTSGQTLTFVGALKNSGMFSIQVAKDKSTAETEKLQKRMMHWLYLQFHKDIFITCRSRLLSDQQLLCKVLD